VVAACLPHGVPVTLKMRTGWCDSEKNAVRIARPPRAPASPWSAVHGRTREQGYRGEAEYDNRRRGEARGGDPGRAPTATSTRRPRRARSSRAPAPTPS
jgi:hypothetical protein